MNGKKPFSPLIFLASLGAGGIAISNFALINYTIPHGKGLIKFSQTHALTSGFKEIIFSALELNMVIFIFLHLVLSYILFKKIIPWLKNGGHKDIINDPIKNSALLAPFISITMTLNVFIGAIRYFIPAISNNLQALILPGFITWTIIWLALMALEIILLKKSFIKGFNVNKINFGWLLHPFALGMATVTGTGIAAMAADKSIADAAFFMSLVSGSMGLFLLSVKLISIFKSHFSQDGLPDKQFLPSFLIVVPNITLYAISFFRIGHYLDHHQGAHLHLYFMIVTVAALAFEVWYFAFGLSLLKNYLQGDFKKEYFISQWGLVCPFVALAVLSAFVYNTFWPSEILFWFIIATITTSVYLFFKLLIKHIRCLSPQEGEQCL